MYEQSDGVERDLAEACRLYESAAAKGHEHAGQGQVLRPPERVGPDPRTRASTYSESLVLPV